MVKKYFKRSKKLHFYERYHYEDDGRRYVFDDNHNKIIDPHHNPTPWLIDDHGRRYIYDNLGQRYVLDEKSNRCYDRDYRGKSSSAVNNVCDVTLLVLPHSIFIYIYV